MRVKLPERMMVLTHCVACVASCRLTPALAFTLFGRWLALPPPPFAAAACLLCPPALTSPTWPPPAISSIACAAAHAVSSARCSSCACSRNGSGCVWCQFVASQCTLSGDTTSCVCDFTEWHSISWGRGCYYGHTVSPSIHPYVLKSM